LKDGQHFQAFYIDCQFSAATLHEDYNNQVSKDFDVTAELLDFRDQKLTVETVNSFVSDATRGMIKDLLPDDFSAPDMMAFLVNAVHFKGQWATRFSEDATQKDVFHGTKGDREVCTFTLNPAKYKVVASFIKEKARSRQRVTFCAQG
ncbi:hypothetical protein COOONC_25016, partial [Cooperia oncophora]